jgi:ADP-ribose pyrophosphatase YjhB (NUDIX family)
LCNPGTARGARPGSSGHVVTVNFCPTCGGRITRQWVVADARERAVCMSCHEVHYENPRILVTAMITWRQRLLLCRRAHAPSCGLWCAPGGFMEKEETLEQAAARELEEETGVRVAADHLTLYTVTNLPAISEVYVVFRGSVSEPTIACGRESLEARFFDQDEIPWQQLAWPELGSYLRLFFREQGTEDFGIHLSRAEPAGGFRRSYRIRAADADWRG